MRRIKKNSNCLKGSLSVETALIFPTIVFGILLIIFFILLFFGRVNTAISINRISNEVSGTYYDAFGRYGAYASGGPTGGIITEAISETLTSRARKERVIKEAIVKEVQGNSPIKLTITPKVEIKNYLLWQSVNLDVKVEYPLILGGIFTMFSKDDMYKDGKFIERYKREIIVSSTESNIRTIDYLGEKIKNSKVVGAATKTVDEIKEKVAEIFK